MQKSIFYVSTFASFVKVSVERACGTAVVRAAEASSIGGGASVLAGTRFMVIAATSAHGAPLHVTLLDLAGETEVGTWRKLW